MRLHLQINEHLWQRLWPGLSEDRLSDLSGLRSDLKDDLWNYLGPNVENSVKNTLLGIQENPSIEWIKYGK